MTTTTQNGEVTIKLVIELHLNANGQIAATALAEAEDADVAILKTKDKVEWEVPDFAPTETIEFGKYEK